MSGRWALGETPAYRPGQIQVVGDRFQNGAKFPIPKSKSHCELGRPRLLTGLLVIIQYRMQNDCLQSFWESASWVCDRDGGRGSRGSMRTTEVARERGAE